MDKNGKMVPRPPERVEEDLKYCIDPLLGLTKQLSNLVEDSRTEIEGLHRMLENKNLDISKLSKENEKYIFL